MRPVRRFPIDFQSGAWVVANARSLSRGVAVCNTTLDIRIYTVAR